MDAYYDGAAYIATADSLATVTAHSNLFWADDATSQNSLATTDIINLNELRRMTVWAEENNINPCKIDGDDCFVLLISPRAVNDLKLDSTFSNLIKDADMRGKKNPLLSMADFKFENILVHKFNRVRKPFSSGNNNTLIERGIFTGAKAVGLGYGSMPELVQRKEDAYKDRKGIGIRQLIGSARATWQNQAETTTLDQSSALWTYVRSAA